MQERRRIILQTGRVWLSKVNELSSELDAQK